MNLDPRPQGKEKRSGGIPLPASGVDALPPGDALRIRSQHPPTTLSPTPHPYPGSMSQSSFDRICALAEQQKDSPKQEEGWTESLQAFIHEFERRLRRG